MDNQAPPPGISAPSLPKGGGAIQSIGKGWGAVGVSGSASFDIALPISMGRGYAPPLVLGYQSTAGNGLFGMGWALNLGCVARRASKGVPTYTDDDVILGPSGEVWLPERGDDGSIVFETVSAYLDLTLGQTYQVIRYFARVEGAFDRMEHWRTDPVDPGFWLVHGADGSLAFYGKNPGSRSTDPADSNHVAEWLLEETMNALGEHILYEYKAEDEAGLSEDSPRDYIAQCYLWRVRYGNEEQSADLYLWNPEQLDDLKWHFDLLFDYGERNQGEREIPTYADEKVWPVRSDPHSSFAYGFELGNLRLCQQVLMFHWFPDEGLGPEPRLINRLLLKYKTLSLGYRLLQEVQMQALAAVPIPPDKGLQFRPPVMFEWTEFAAEKGGFQAFDAMPGLNDGQRYQLVDLYGDGVPGVLYQQDQGWYYREPMRDENADSPDAIAYGPWQLLPRIPTADARSPVRQSLMDLTGDGKLDWIVAQPGMAGFFTLNHDRSWSEFATFAAFPPEFFHPQGQLADLVGGGLNDLALIGPRSVRLYASRRAGGFAPGIEVRHDEDSLPLLSNSPTELVAFSDILGTGQQHLIRIRHDGIWFWPNMGRGRFGSGKLFAPLPFSYETFDAGRIRLADMDGSGAADLLYLEPDHFSLFMNRGGNGLDEPYVQNWPDGVRYDRFCQVSLADIHGLGCSSLVLTTPHMTPRHWRFDYSQPAPPLTCFTKPYLLQRSTNNMGALGEVFYRSSAQEWLDEKNELIARKKVPVPELPFPVQVVVRQTQLDQITENLLTQRYQYRQGFYDGHEREFRGFGLLIQTDTEKADQDAESTEGFTAPVLTKTWFHTGRHPLRETCDHNASDPDAQELGAHLLTGYDGASDSIIAEPDEATLQEMARALVGSVLHAEVFGLDGDVAQTVPYSTQSARYLVRQLAPSGAHQPYARMLPLALESISYRYERQADDPQCDRSVSLAWDEYGVLLHSVSVNCARRKKSGDEPPFSDEHQQTWWQASHDDAQQKFYFQETRSEPIHLAAAQSWRLGLPYRQRSNAMLAPATEFSVDDISYEQFVDPLSTFSLLPRTLTALSVQRYVGCEGKEATFVALPDAIEQAELDEHALSAYDRVMTREQLIERLKELKYQLMPSFLPEDGLNLWSVRRVYNTYEDAAGFYRVNTFRPTGSHGLSTVEYDPYDMLVTRLTDPAGCETSAKYEYRTLQPVRITDPNQNTQQAAYDGFGQVVVTSFYGTEAGGDVGFDLIETVPGPITPDEAITSAPSCLRGHATFHCHDAFSWMWGTPKTPVHSAMLVADRYPDDPERQIRISLVSYDGFGRVLQTRQLVEDGDAYKVDASSGTLEIKDSAPITVAASPRWRVSERVEYNNKGLPIRMYRPYFASEHCYIKDQSFREWGVCDKQLYDPLGRPTITLTAADWMRRQTYLTWYTISEDENDTEEEMLAIRQARPRPPGARGRS